MCIVILHGWSIPCCAAVSASISMKGSLLAVGASLCGVLGDDTEGGAEESTQRSKTTFDTLRQTHIS